MGVIVKVTRRGQTTIPKVYRRMLGISEGDLLHFEVVDGKLIVSVIPKIWSLAGVDADIREVEDVIRDVERMREEY